MPRVKSDKIAVWAAVGPDGNILISSVSAYQTVANRWAAKYRNHEVKRLCEIDRESGNVVHQPKVKIEPSVKNGNGVVGIPIRRKRVASK